MKATIFSLLCAVLLVTTVNADAQILKTLGDKAKVKVGQRANQKVDKAMDKGLDEMEEGTKVKKDGDGDVKVKEADGSKVKVDADGDTKIKNADGTTEKGTNSSTLSYTSKYDFVPGEKVLHLKILMLLQLVISLQNGIPMLRQK
jgi:preprotein translocase subunit YajC